MMNRHNHTLVFTTGGGRLGNQLLNYANLLAFSLEHPDFDIINLAFSPYAAEYGNNSLTDSSVGSGGLGKPWNALVQLARTELPVIESIPYSPFGWLRLETAHRTASYRSDAHSIIGGETHTRFQLTGDRYDHFNLTAQRNVNRLRSRPVSLVAGWSVRGWPLVEKHAAEVRQRLQPGDRHQSAAARYVDPLREEFDALVGVLVRQGDYQTWNDGRYFFEPTEYREILLNFATEFPDSHVGFLLASDEPQSESVFADDRFVFTTGIAGGSGHYVESFAELSLCDVVVTPPSTFSITASFLGDTPVVPLYEGVRDDDWERLESPLVESIDHPEMNNAVN